MSKAGVDCAPHELAHSQAPDCEPSAIRNEIISYSDKYRDAIRIIERMIRDLAGQIAVPSRHANEPHADAPSSQKDALLPLSKLATMLPVVRGDKPPHRATLYNWATVGLKTRSGRRARLETQFIGGTLCSSLAAVERLCDAKNDVRYVDPPAELTPRERADMEARSRAALDRLAEMGIRIQ